MALQKDILSEQEIFTALQEDYPLAWEHFYDKYAPAMYSLIYKLTENELLAEGILLDVFLELKQNQILSKIKNAAFPVILRHTHSFAIQHLKKIDIPPKTLKIPAGAGLIHLLTTGCSSISEAASILNLTVEESKKELHLQFRNLRMGNLVLDNVSSDNDIYKENLQNL